MKIHTIGKHKVETYTSIDEMPIARYHLFSKYLLVDSGIGASVGAVDTHLAKTIDALKLGDTSAAIQELENMRQSIHLIETGADPQGKAFAALIGRIDGQDVTDISEEGLDRLLQSLPDLTVGQLLREIEGAKKKYGDGT